LDYLFQTSAFPPVFSRVPAESRAELHTNSSSQELRSVAKCRIDLHLELDSNHLMLVIANQLQVALAEVNHKRNKHIYLGPD